MCSALRRGLSFLDAPSPVHGFRLERRLVGHAVEPIANLRARNDRSCLADEHQERRLEGIFRIGPVQQNTLANAENHRSMAADEQLECPIVAVGDESLEQLGVGGLGIFVLARDLADVADNALKLTVRHGVAPVP